MYLIHVLVHTLYSVKIFVAHYCPFVLMLYHLRRISTVKILFIFVRLPSCHEYRIWGNFQTSNFWITTKWNISNGFIFKFPARPPCGKCIVPTRWSMFSVESMVRSYYVYWRAWKASVGEELPCQKEQGNLVDPFNPAGNFRIGFILVWLLVVRIIQK